MYNQTIRLWWPTNIIETLKVAGYSWLSQPDNRVIVKVCYKTARRQRNCLKVVHCIVENSFKFFSFVLIKKVTFQRSISCRVTEPGKWQCVAFVPAIAARFAVAMLHRLRSWHRQCRGNHSVKIPQWSEPQSGVLVIVIERGEICSYEVME